MELLKDLNSEQLKAVKHKDGPLLIVAGAGTGKTTAITRRLAFLIEQGLAKPEEILALTFTEKAAGEMAERVDSLLPYGYFDLWILTFHGFGERILKEHGLAIGLPTDFKLLNEFEQWALVKKNLDKFELDYYRPMGNPGKFIRALIKHFSRAKDENITPAAYLEYANGLRENLDEMLGGGKSRNPKFEIRNSKQILNSPPSPKLRRTSKFQISNENAGTTREIAGQEVARLNEVANAYHVYQQLLLDNNYLDFGDLINYCLKLFRERPAILEKYRRQFKYILLDEFQDTNWSQYELIKILAAPRNNLVVVGDDDQSIYKFRGASLSNILQFKNDFPDAAQTILTKNYRSKQNILDLAYEFIKLNNPHRLEWQLGNPKSDPPAGGRNPKQILNLKSQITNKSNSLAGGINPNERRLNKKLVAENSGQGEIEIIQGADLAEEVESVVDKIVKLKSIDKAATWNDFAILIRANDSATEFMAELDRRGLSYIFGASRGLYAKPVIVDAISYFKLLDNYHESAAVWRILNLPIYNFTNEELVNFNHLAAKKALSLYEVLNRAEILKFSAELQEKIKPVLALIGKHSTLARDKTVSQVFLAFLNDSGYLKYLTRQPDFCHLSPPAGGERSVIDEKSGIIDSSLPAVAQNDKGAGLAEQKSLETVGFLNQFLKRLQAFENSSDDKTVKAFLAELNLELEAGEEGSLSPDLEAGPEAIKILTVHGAKGLEFKYVFIVNLVDKRFPTIQRSEPINLPDALIKEILPEGDVHLEEERRLFYVAMTRAKAGLYFSWSQDYGGKAMKKPSRFLMELDLVKKTASLKKGDTCPTERLQSFGREGVLRKNELGKMENSKIPLTPNVRGGEKAPAHFSYSQLAAYSNCPYQYRFAHILKIPVMGKEQFSFGKTMHSTLQKLFVLINEKKGLGQGNLFSPLPTSPAPSVAGEGDARAGIVTFDEILKLYEQSWIDDWYESKQKKQARKKQGQEILKVFYEKHRANWPNVLFLEKGFNLKISDPAANHGAGDAVYTIRGVIDRIDQVGPSTGLTSSGQVAGLKLVDYKTGQAKETLTFEQKEQLFIYQLAVVELFKQPVSGLTFYYLENNTEVEFLGSQRDLEKVKNKIISTIKDIGRGEFPAKPGRICAWCDFREICEFRE